MSGPRRGEVFARFAVSMFDHPKWEPIMQLPPRQRNEIIGAWIACLAYCQKNLTDGVIHNRALKGIFGQKMNTSQCRLWLESRGLLEPDPSGVYMHEFPLWNRTRNDVIEHSQRQTQRRMSSTAGGTGGGTNGTTGGAPTGQPAGHREVNRRSTDHTHTDIQPSSSTASREALSTLSSGAARARARGAAHGSPPPGTSPATTEEGEKMREKTITAAVDELRQRLALTTGPRNVAHVADGHDRLTEFLGRPPTEDEHRQIVAYAAAHPWWEGAARSASAVYGPHLTTYATEALAIDPLAGVRTAIAATDERWADYTERIAARASAAKAKGEKFEQTADELAEATEIADEADRLHTERKRIQAEAAEQHRRRG